MDALDGNAIAGDLFAAFGHEMTTAVGTCASCGASSAIAELRVYVSGPGTVARCPGCASVAIVLVRGTARFSGYELAGPRTEGLSNRAGRGYAIAGRADALDFMAAYPGYGEQRWYSDALGTEQVSFSWRRMPPATGGRGSYGHRHPGQEEVFFVIAGTVTFKVGDDVFEAGAQTAVRMTGQEGYSVHNDSDAEAELLIFSTRLADAPFEKVDGFWP